MSAKAKSLILKYGISIAICTAFTVMMLTTGEFPNAQTLADQFRYISDAFSIPGILTLMSALLVVVSNEGAFYGIGYALSVAGKALLPGGRGKMEKYADYVERKAGKKITGFGFLFIVGGIWLAIGLVFMLLFNLQ